MPLRTSPDPNKARAVPISWRKEDGHVVEVGWVVVKGTNVLSRHYHDTLDVATQTFLNTKINNREMIIDYTRSFVPYRVQVLSDETVRIDPNDLATTAKRIAESTKLPIETCSTLLVFGWQYVEEFGKIPRWEHPTHKLKDFDVNYRACVGSFDSPVTENTVCDICGLKLKEHPWFDDVTISPVSVDLKEKK